MLLTIRHDWYTYYFYYVSFSVVQNISNLSNVYKTQQNQEFTSAVGAMSKLFTQCNVGYFIAENTL
jgi:hypothetical protein